MGLPTWPTSLRPQHLTPFNVATLTAGVIAIDAGSSQSCALMNYGGVKCWGAGGLGNGVGNGSYIPVNVLGTPDGKPGAPTIGTATAGNAQISVAFTTPVVIGGSAITSYTATCGIKSNSGASSPIVVTGLTNGTAVTCTVIATNSLGDSPSSAPSNSATPVAAGLDILPLSLTFPATSAGTGSVRQTVTISNGTANAVTIGATMNTPGEFGHFAPSCGSTIAAMGTCTIEVELAPAAVAAIGPISGTLSIPTSGGNLSVALSGSVTSYNTSASPATIVFADTLVSQNSASQVVTITNNGSGTSNVGAINLGGSDPAQFTLVSNTCTAPLVSLGTCTATIRFAPTVTGAKSALLQFNQRGANLSVPVSGTALVAGAPVFNPSATTLTFAAQTVGTTGTPQTLIITNTGNANLFITNTAISGPFAIGANSCTTAVLPAGNCGILVTFTPTAAGAASGALTITANATGSPHNIALAGTGTAVPVAAPYAYITNESAGTVSVIDIATNTIVASIPVGSGPFGVAVNPAGSRAYVANGGSDNVSVINTATNTVIATVLAGSIPTGVAVNPAGTRAYVTNGGSNSVTVIDTANNNVVTTVTGIYLATGVVVNPAGTRVFVTGGSALKVIDASTNAVVGTVSLQVSPARGVTVNAVGTLVYVANGGGDEIWVIDAVTNAVVTTISLGNGGPMGVALNPDGTRLYVTNYNGNSVRVIDTTNYAVLATISVGVQPIGIQVDASGLRAYVANSFHGNFSVIDTTTNTVISTIAAGAGASAFGTFLAPPPPPDTTPDAYSFASKAGVAVSSIITSAPATIQGINSPSPISVANGSYSIGCTATFVTAPGTITNGQTVCVQHGAAATAGASVTTTLTIGGVSGTFTSTTSGLAVPGAPTIGAAAPGNSQVAINFSAPSNNGGMAITGYIATSSPGGFTGTCAAPCTSITVTGLTNGTTYTFSVNAINSVGTGPASAASNSVAPNMTMAPVIRSALPASGTVGNAYSHTFTASGVPATMAWSITIGALPAGLTLNATSGVLAGIPTAAGTSNFTVQAANGVPSNATQSVSLTIAAAPPTLIAQTITFSPLANRALGSPPFNVSAAGGASGSPVMFTVAPSGVCTSSGIDGSTITLVGEGLCTITANQAGSAQYSAANAVSQTFTVAPSLPNAPTGLRCRAGVKSVACTFDPPVANSGPPFSAYILSCESRGTNNTIAAITTITGTSSPLTLTGLRSGLLATCSVAAISSIGTGPSSNAVVVLPYALTANRGGIDPTGDGQSKLLVRGLTGANAGQLLLGTLDSSTGKFMFTNLSVSGMNQRILGVGDFGGRHKSDLLFQDNSTGLVSFWIGFDGFIDSRRTIRTVKPGWSVEAVTDIDGDGYADIVWRFTSAPANPSPNDNGVVFVWFMKDGVIDEVKYHGGAPISWSLIGAADLHGNGRGDLVWVSPATTSPASQIRSITALPNRGRINELIGILPTGYTLTRLGDFNGDGKSDLLFRNAQGQLKLWLMNGVNVVSMIDLPASDATWELYAVADLNGDGTSDLVFKKPDDTLVVWLMNAATPAQPTIITNAGTVPSGFVNIDP